MGADRHESDRGKRMVQFIECLTVPEGMHQGKPLRLRPWQKPLIEEVYGPVDENGLRIVRKAIFSVSKKNGKTPCVAALSLGHLVGPEAKVNEQLYSGAYDRDQASLVFRYMRQMVEADEELADILIIRESRKEIFNPLTGSLFKALSSEVKGKHGIGPALLIIDELAMFGADRLFYDTLAQGRGAHAEPLLWIIGTQADNDLAVLSQEIDYALKVQRGEIRDPTVKLFLFTTPPDVDPFDEKNWAASNPALGDFLNLADMQEAARTAKNMPSAEGNFRNLRLNQRISAADQFIGPMQWKACGGEPDLKVFKNARVFGGLDLSGKNDLTSLELVALDPEDIWHAWSYFWTPGDGLKERENRDRAPYTAWVDGGFLTAKPGKTIDYRYVALEIGRIHGQVHIDLLMFDRWRIDDFVRAADEVGLELVVATWVKNEETGARELEVPEHDDSAIVLVPFGQGYMDMNPAVQAVEDVIVDERLRHGNHPVLTWCASNTRIQSDPAGNRKFDKIKSTGRIDGMVSLAMALRGGLLNDPDKPSVYESRGLRSL